MKKTGIVVGLFTAIAFCAGAIAATEPESGRFSFQARTPEPVSHFINLKIRSVGKMPNDGNGNQVLGVNVYWKTKDKNQLQGRKYYTAQQPNLPRAGFNFTETYPGTKSVHHPYIYQGNHENIEWLVWEGVNMDYEFDNGCPPTAGNTSTRFYNYRFARYEVENAHSANCSESAKISTPQGEDFDVALTSFAISHNEGICNRMGSMCIGYKGSLPITLAQDIFIPSNRLEFLIIEVFGFEYNTNAQQANQSFYTFPMQAIKFEPGTKSGHMNLIQAVRGEGEFAEFGVSDFVEGGTGDEKGYYNAESSRFYQDEAKTQYCDVLGRQPCDFNFGTLDSLVLDLQYTNESKIPKWNSPFGTGIILTLTPAYFNEACVQDSSECNFPPR